MLDEAKLKTIIANVLSIPAENISSDTNMDTVEKWDSLQHMILVLALEDAFEITILDDEAANITSYPLIKLVIKEQLQGT